MIEQLGAVVQRFVTNKGEADISRGRPRST